MSEAKKNSYLLLSSSDTWYNQLSPGELQKVMAANRAWVGRLLAEGKTRPGVALARNGATVGIGAAQASRNVSVEISLKRAGDRAKLAVMASDAYFPFPDGIQIAANAGVTAIIQPGGSIRDEMAIEVANRHHLAMVFTGRRHFRH